MSFKHNQFPVNPLPASNEIFFQLSEINLARNDFQNNYVSKKKNKTEERRSEGAKLNKRLVKTVEFPGQFSLNTKLVGYSEREQEHSYMCKQSLQESACP